VGWWVYFVTQSTLNSEIYIVAYLVQALGDYVRAGDDFETAKTISPDDPNFAVSYKAITHCAYMEVGSDPDIVEPFPPLLPVPGLGAK
jgi:hypothetical protein